MPNIPIKNYLKYLIQFTSSDDRKYLPITYKEVEDNSRPLSSAVKLVFKKK